MIPIAAKSHKGASDRETASARAGGVPAESDPAALLAVPRAGGEGVFSGDIRGGTGLRGRVGALGVASISELRAPERRDVPRAGLRVEVTSLLVGLGDAVGVVRRVTGEGPGPVVPIIGDEESSTVCERV